MLYLLGLNYGAVSLALEALGAYLCQSRVYDAVRAAAEKVPGLKRQEVFAEVKAPAMGGDVTSVKCNGERLHLGLTVDDNIGLVLVERTTPQTLTKLRTIADIQPSGASAQG
jgi:hypothetical protein